MFDMYAGSYPLKAPPSSGPNPEHAKWLSLLVREGLEQKSEFSKKQTFSNDETVKLAQAVFEDVQARAEREGVVLTQADYGHLINRLAELGKLADLIASAEVEDIAINLKAIYAFTTRRGWNYVAPEEGEISSLRVEMSRNGKAAPTYETPIVDAMLRVQVYTEEGLAVRNVRINYIGEPASAYGDLVTLRVSRRPSAKEAESDPLENLCINRLPPVCKPAFMPKVYSNTGGVFCSGAANYLLSVMVSGGTLVIAGATGSGKTYVARSLYQAMLNHFPKGSIRVFIVEDSQEIVLNAWDGDPAHDTGNVLYTVTRPRSIQGPPPVSMYDLVSAALRQRPHGVVIGEGARSGGMGVGPGRLHRSRFFGFYDPCDQCRDHLAPFPAGGAGPRGRQRNEGRGYCPGICPGRQCGGLPGTQFYRRPDRHACLRGGGGCRPSGGDSRAQAFV